MGSIAFGSREVMPVKAKIHRTAMSCLYFLQYYVISICVISIIGTFLGIIILSTYSVVNMFNKYLR